MPNRILREGILSSERINCLTWAEEVFYRRLMSVVDDFGRYYAHPSLLRAALYPLQLEKVSDGDIGKWLLSSEKAGLVTVYPAEDGKRYLELVDFRQHIRAKDSKFPSSCACSAHATHTHSGRSAHAPVFVFEDGDVVATPDGVACPRPNDADPQPPPALKLVNGRRRAAGPDCPHEAILALWAEVLPALPQHDPALWRGQRADHLRARWRETAAAKGWRTQDEGLAYLRKLFAYVGSSAFLTGRKHARDRGPFYAELAWLVEPENWAKVHEGKYHAEVA